jgi:ABC-type lipoprotein export system ATPase subunit
MSKPHAFAKSTAIIVITHDHKATELLDSKTIMNNESIKRERSRENRSEIPDHITA